MLSKYENIRHLQNLLFKEFNRISLALENGREDNCQTVTPESGGRARASTSELQVRAPPLREKGGREGGPPPLFLPCGHPLPPLRGISTGNKRARQIRVKQFVLLPAVKVWALDIQVIKNHYVKTKNKRKATNKFKTIWISFLLFVLKGKRMWGKLQEAENYSNTFYLFYYVIKNPYFHCKPIQLSSCKHSNFVTL